MVDYIIIGRGICGTLLACNLLKLGASVLIVDDPARVKSTRVASGLINPVTGKRLVRSWLYDTLLPAALDTYRQIEAETGSSLLRETDLLQYHITAEVDNLFKQRQEEDDTFLSQGNEAIWQPYFETRYGIGNIAPCWLIDGEVLLNGAINNNSSCTILEEPFYWYELKISDAGVHYKDVFAKKVICCEGAAGTNNPYFSLLPFSLNKGEVIIARIPGLPHTHIYQQAFKIIPLKDDLFWIGSSFEWKYDGVQPTVAFREKVKAALTYWLKLPYEIIDHWAAERPSPIDYKPFVGVHPRYLSIGILNGMGTKGFLQAPYFAKHMAEHLVNGTSLPAEGNIKRFQRILSR